MAFRVNLPDALTSLIHHVELTKAGWRDRAFEYIVLSGLMGHPEGSTEDSISCAVNTVLGTELGKAKVISILDRLVQKDILVRLPDGSLKLAEKTNRELNEYGRQGQSRSQDR